MKRIKLLFTVLLLKIKYGNSLKLSTLKISIPSLNTITIEKGSIISKGYLKISKNSNVSVKNGGTIEFGSNFYANTNMICVAHKSIKFGKNVSIGPNCCFFDHNHYFDCNGQTHGKFRCDDIQIGNNVWIGANCVILKGTRIGDNCIIGAGTIICNNIESNSIVTSSRELKIDKLRSK